MNPHRYSNMIWTAPILAIAWLWHWWLYRNVPVFIVEQKLHVNGRGMIYYGRNPFGEVSRSYPIGKRVRVEGRVRTIKTYEYFAIDKIRAGDGLGLHLEDEE